MDDIIRTNSLILIQEAEDRINRFIESNRISRRTPLNRELSRLFRFCFPGRDISFLPTVLRNIRRVKRIIPTVTTRDITSDFIAINPPIGDGARHEASIISRTPAAAFPNNRYIAIYPSFDDNPRFQNGIFIHECFHMIGMRGHGLWGNPFAYQAFILELNNVPYGLRATTNLNENRQNLERIRRSRR